MDNSELLIKIEKLEKDLSALKAKRYGIKEYFKNAFRKTNVLVGIAAGFMITTIIVYAATVSKPHTFSENGTISSSEVNSNFDTLYNLVNGNLNDDNINGISGTKINAGSINISRLPSQVIRNVAYTIGLTNLWNLNVGGGLLDASTNGYMNSLTLTTTGKPVRISCSFPASLTVGSYALLDVYMDNASIVPYMSVNPGLGFLGYISAASAQMGGTLSFDYIFTGIPAGVHSFKLRYTTGGNTVSLFFTLGTFYAEELTNL